MANSFRNAKATRRREQTSFRKLQLLREILSVMPRTASFGLPAVREIVLGRLTDAVMSDGTATIPSSVGHLFEVSFPEDHEIWRYVSVSA